MNDGGDHGIRTGGAEFVAGILHDVGKLVLDLCYPQKLSKAIRITEDTGVSMMQAEEDVFQTNHAMTGAWLLQHWNLPEVIVDAVRFHHEPEQSKVAPMITSIVHLADLFARESGSGFGGERTTIRMEETPAWEKIRTARLHDETIDLEGLTSRLADEMRRHQGMFLFHANLN